MVAVRAAGARARGGRATPASASAPSWAPARPTKPACFLPGCCTPAGWTGITIRILIDLIHVLEYLWKAAWSLHAAGDPAAGDWVAVKALAVLAGDSARVAAEITAEPDAAGLTAGQR